MEEFEAICVVAAATSTMAHPAAIAPHLLELRRDEMETVLLVRLNEFYPVLFSNTSMTVVMLK